ncbi:hypothetical protein V2J09_010377 [Rumex salicifolius]
MSMTGAKAANEEKVFSKIDANNDRRISASELQLLLLSLTSGASTEEVSRMMEKIDKDNDDYIDFNEFASDGDLEIGRILLSLDKQLEIVYCSSTILTPTAMGGEMNDGGNRQGQRQLN